MKLKKKRELIWNIGNLGTEHATFASSQKTANFCFSRVVIPKNALKVLFMKLDVLKDDSTVYFMPKIYYFHGISIDD